MLFEWENNAVCKTGTEYRSSGYQARRGSQACFLVKLLYGCSRRLVGNKVVVSLEVSFLILTLVAALGLHRVVLPESKFSGEEDVREFLRDFEMYVAVNEWLDKKAGQYLAVFLKDDTKAFFSTNSRRQ